MGWAEAKKFFRCLTMPLWCLPEWQKSLWCVAKIVTLDKADYDEYTEKECNPKLFVFAAEALKMTEMKNSRGVCGIVKEANIQSRFKKLNYPSLNVQFYCEYLSKNLTRTLQTLHDYTAGICWVIKAHLSH